MTSTLAASDPAHQVPLARLLDATADAVAAVRGGRSLTDVLARVPPPLRPGVQALSFHALRWLGSAQVLREQLAPKPPPPHVDALLLVALALLWPTSGADGAPPYPEHTLVDQAVAAMRQRAPAAANFANAVLRRFLREQAALVAAVRHSPLGAFNHPLWWIEKLKLDWPAQWQALLLGANHKPPMTLRVNARRGSGEAYVQRLAALGRSATLQDDPPWQTLGRGQTVVLAEPCPVAALHGFAEGEVSVQDAAAQRAAPLLLGPAPGIGGPLPPGARVLDACAAPGGKTAHLLELAELDVLALDSDPVRLARVQDTLNRLQLRATPSAIELRAGDARQPRQWWDGRPFDAILLDAPCTASGIVRRHPDVRWLRRADDVHALARVQAEMLDALWPLLKPGGRLVYATCSLFRDEGSRQIDAFTQRRPPGVPNVDVASPGHLLPTADNAPQGVTGRRAMPQDGFFYALIHKTQNR